MYSQALRYAFSSRADLGNLEISGFCTDVTQIVRVFLLKMFPEALSMTLPSLVFSALLTNRTFRSTDSHFFLVEMFANQLYRYVSWLENLTVHFWY